MNAKVNHLFKVFTALCLLTCYPAAHATIIPVAGGDDIGSPLVGPNLWTLDLGYALSGLPDTVDRVLFEAGGDGTGISLVLLGTELTVYQDQGDFLASSPVGDDFFSVDIAAFANQVVSIRLNADLTADTLSLSAFNGTTTLTSGIINTTTDLVNSAGGNATGVGGFSADLGGLDESAEAGFPDIASLFGAAYQVTAPVGANVLGSDVLVGTLYTDADLPPAMIPDPSSWGLIPEPSSAALLGVGVIMVSVLRRRRR